MLAFDLFSPLAEDGAIFCLRPSSSASYAPFRWDTAARKWVPAPIAMDKFMAMHTATVPELRAAGLSAAGQ